MEVSWLRFRTVTPSLDVESNEALPSGTLFELRGVTWWHRGAQPVRKKPEWLWGCRWRERDGKGGRVVQGMEEPPYLAIGAQVLKVVQLGEVGDAALGVHGELTMFRFPSFK